MTTSARASRRGVLAALAAGAGCLGAPGTPTPTVGEPSGTPVESLPAPVQGDPDADVTVLAFEDYACPHCAAYVLDVLPELERAYVEPGTIRYEHHDYPIPVDGQWSWAAAGAARAVQAAAGDDAFFAYSRRLFENQDRYSMDLLGSLATEVGADPDAVERAAQQGTYRPVLEADRKRGREMGLDGTPEIYVNGQKTPDYAYATIESAIEAARP